MPKRWREKGLNRMEMVHRMGIISTDANAFGKHNIPGWSVLHLYLLLTVHFPPEKWLYPHHALDHSSSNGGKLWPMQQRLSILKVSICMHIHHKCSPGFAMRRHIYEYIFFNFHPIARGVRKLLQYPFINYQLLGGEESEIKHPTMRVHSSSSNTFLFHTNTHISTIRCALRVY